VTERSEIERIGYYVRCCTKCDKPHLHTALQVDLKWKVYELHKDWPTPGSRVLLETNSRSAGYEIRCLVCNLQSHYRVRMTTTLVPIPRQTYPVHITSYFRNIYFSTIFQFTYHFPRASSTQVSDWHYVGTSHYSRVCYMSCQSHILCFAKFWEFLITKIYFSLVLGGLTTQRVTASCSPASSIYYLLLGRGARKIMQEF